MDSKDYPFNPSNPCSSYHSLSLIPLIYFRDLCAFCVHNNKYLCAYFRKRLRSNVFISSPDVFPQKRKKVGVKSLRFQ